MALFGVGRPTAVFSQTVSGEGEAHIYGNLQLDLLLSTPAGQPGDIVDLTVTLTNHTQATISPNIDLQLPNGVRPATMLFPAGLSTNLQAGTLDWLPVSLATVA